MPLAIPVVVGAVAGAASAAAGFAIAGSIIVGSIVVGAVAGAVVGGIQAAVTGGNILEGVLFGTVGGAVGGALAGWGMEAMGWAGEGTAGSEAAIQAAYDKEFVELGGGVYQGQAAAGAGMGTAEQLAVQGGMAALSAGLKSDPETPYSQTKEGVEAELASRQKIAEIQAGAARGGGSSGAVEAAAINAAQRQREAELNASLTREKMKQDASEFDKTLAQRKQELERPIEEANAARARQRETSIGLTLMRKQKQAEAAAQQSTEQYQEDLLA